MTGDARAVLSAPKLALALGYDVEAELERLRPNGQGNSPDRYEDGRAPLRA